MLANQYSELLHLHMLLELLGILFHSGLFGYYFQELGKKMIDKKQKYIITLLVDNREWNSQPIEGKLGDLQTIIDEAEAKANEMGWTTTRHGNYPTTDLPIVELPTTLQFLKVALVERIYPLLRQQFGEFLPDGGKSLRVADGFIVKYDAEGGQTELKPHRDGSVLSFNIALNPMSEFDGGGTWFASLDGPVKIDQGEIVSHSSSLLHGGHGITRGKRYIIVCFVILEGYDSWSMRFYNQVRNL